MTDLESKFLDGWNQGRRIDLERALLIVSGISTEEQIADYKAKLDQIEQDFTVYASTIGVRDDIQVARTLHEFFWKTKPNRYNSHFLLKDVIDAQLQEDPNIAVGNCLGLTSLYTVLGSRQGLDLTILASPYHVSSRLRTRTSICDIENTSQTGFDKKTNGIPEKPAEALITAAYNSRGVTKGDFGDLEGAVNDFSKAIQLDPGHAFAYNNRGAAKENLGDLEGAMRDYNKAIQLNPEDAIARRNLERVRHFSRREESNMFIRALKSILEHIR